MNNKNKKILSTFIFSILIVSFFYFYFSSDNKAGAASLVFCVNATNSNDYYIIDDTYTCPAGYNKVDGDYNLILNGGYNSNPPAGSGSNTPANNSGTSNNGSNSNTVISTVGSGLSGQNGSQSSSIQNQNSGEVIIQADPYLANGPFTLLDPSDYPYCVTLTHDLAYGTTDSTSGREVSALQLYLTDRGFVDTGATGFYGRITELGVRKFQYRNQIEVTGVVTSEMRDILKELTCAKYPKVSYVDKPVSPSPIKTTVKKATTSTVKATTKPAVVIPATKADTATKTVVIIPQATTPANTNNSISTLSSYGGNMYLSQKNNLYFSYLTKSSRPYICVNINNTDCTQASNYGPVVDGIVKGYYEVVSVSGKWSFNIYNGSIWGSVGDKVKIYLKDSQAANTVSIYTLNIFN